MNKDAIFRLSFIPPMGRGERRAVEITLDERQWREAFDPLPRNREIPFEIEARMVAQEMKIQRRRLAASIAEKLTAKLIEIIQQGDPQFGYSPDEWAKIRPEAARGEQKGEG